MISIIVPIYNSEKYLRECLDSITLQSYSQYEVILVNDGSTDSSSLICEEYVRKDSRFSVINISNSGVCCARNTGIKKANGEYIAFIDSDDRYDKDFLEVLHTEITKNKADIAFCDFYDETGKENPNWQNCIIEKEEIFNKYVEGYFKNRIMNKLYRREIADVIFPEKRPLMEDAYWTGTVLLKCNRAVCVSDGKYFYRVLKSSISHKSRSEDIENGSFANQLDLYLIQLKNTTSEDTINSLITSILQRIEWIILSFNNLSNYDIYSKIKRIMHEINTISPKTKNSDLSYIINNYEDYYSAQKQLFFLLIFKSSISFRNKLFFIYRRVKRFISSGLKKSLLFE